MNVSFDEKKSTSSEVRRDGATTMTMDDRKRNQCTINSIISVHCPRLLTQIKGLWHDLTHTHIQNASINNKRAKTIRDRSTNKKIPWFRRRLHMGSACMKGPSFWCSASNSDRYWLQKQQPPFTFLNPEHTNSSKANQTDKAKSKGCSTKSRRLCLFSSFDLKNITRKNKPTHLSTSGLLLIWGEAALAGEKLGLYKPDMAHFCLVFLKDWKKNPPASKKKLKKKV